MEAADHLALSKGHAGEVVTGRATLLTLKGVQVPVINKVPGSQEPDSTSKAMLSV